MNRNGLGDFLRTHPQISGIVVCPEKKFIYMKAAKTAGTSILRKMFESQLPGIIHLKDHPNKFQDWLSSITDAELEEYYIFAVVRNPWDRFVSIATYFSIPFDSFINNYSEYVKRDDIKVHSLPLNMSTHMNGSRFADKICKIENLQADMDEVLDVIGLKRQPIPHANKSKHKHYSKYYSDEQRHFVADMYKTDIKLYGYSYENTSNFLSRLLKK